MSGQTKKKAIPIRNGLFYTVALCCSVQKRTIFVRIWTGDIQTFTLSFPIILARCWMPQSRNASIMLFSDWLYSVNSYSTVTGIVT